VRTFLPMREKQEALSARPTLRVDKPVAGYARRSPAYAKDKEKDKSQSREMQTEDLKEWAIMQRWKEEDFHPYFADFGLSGALRPDQRPDMLRLFDDIDAGKYDHSSALCWQENRLFRDETQIYYNQFIQKCLEHDIVVVVVSPYLMIYDFRDDLLTEIFRWKCKESADFIKRHVKGWMLPARYRAAWIDGEWAGLGDPPTGFIVDFNEDSPTYKKLIPYWPHAEKKRELRLLFVELGCNTSLLYRRLQAAPIIFPEFEAGVDPRNVKRFKMARYPGGGYYPKGINTIIKMLTDPNDIGYRAIEGVIRRDSKGEKIKDHDAICDRELFDLCYYPLAKTDLDGNPLEGRKTRRFFQSGKTDEQGMLKFRIISSQGEVHTRSQGVYAGNTPLKVGGYYIETVDEHRYIEHRVTLAAIPCEELDTIIVDRLMEHVRTISQNKDEIAEYEKKAKVIREERQRKSKQVEASIKAIDKEQAGLTRSLGSVEAEIAEAEQAQDEEKKELKQRLKQLIVDQINTLEIERRKLIQAKNTLAEEAASDLGTLDKELENLEEQWPNLTFAKRRSFINFLVREVVIDTMSTHWLRVQVLWLQEQWGREEMYYYRNSGRRKEWSHEEEELVRAHYTTMPKPTLMHLLPDRGWDAIRCYALSLGLTRTLRGRPVGETVGGDDRTSYTDLQFIKKQGIDKTVKFTNWERRSSGR